MIGPLWVGDRGKQYIVGGMMVWVGTVERRSKDLGKGHEDMKNDYAEPPV
jgi:hypothetical protein